MNSVALNHQFELYCVKKRFKPLSNDKKLDCSKFKVPADDKIKGTQKSKFVSGCTENILGKLENVGNRHVLLFPKCFQTPSSSGSLKLRTVWYRGNSSTYGIIHSSSLHKYGSIYNGFYLELELSIGNAFLDY